VREGWVSRQRAESVYGVCFGANGEIDREATAARRLQLGANGQAPSQVNYSDKGADRRSLSKRRG
jgi:hypothetical protein